MKIAIIYATKTGHSKKFATAIAQELNVTASDVTQKPDLNEVDFLFIVGGIYGGKCAPELVKFVKTIDASQVKKVALITSSASKVACQKEIRQILVDKNIKVMEKEHCCQGNFLFVSKGHPNTEDIKGAVEFAKQTINA